jgi:hypothetical protein
MEYMANDNVIIFIARERRECALNGIRMESKAEGRFFAMMSWKLRLDFMVTEHLIKRDFLDLFRGITMKDSLI